MIRKIQIIFVFKTSRLWKIFTSFAYADIIGSTYIACRNKFLTKNENISRTSRNVLLLLCAKTCVQIVICSKCSFLLSVNLMLFFFLKFRKIVTRSNHLQRRKPILFHDLLKLVYETNFIRVEIFEVFLTRHYGFKDIAFNTARENWWKYHRIKLKKTLKE